MSSSKKQQSFSSYSEDKNKTKKVEEQEEGFSEYEEESSHYQKNSTHQQNVLKSIPQQRRRYSYGKIEQKSATYKYLDSFNDLPIKQGSYYTASLKDPRKSKFIMSTGSPCGIGSFDSVALLEYEQCYLSGLNKYYKSHNYNKKPQTKLSVTSSVDKQKSVERSLDRSQYWNGQKFDYFKEKLPIKQKELRKFLPNQTKKKVQVERNLNSGLIVNKKQLKQIKASNTLKPKQDTSNYIKIQQHPSNTKNYSQTKKFSKQNGALKMMKDRQVLIQRQLKQNTTITPKTKQTDFKFSHIEVQPKASILMQKQYSILLAQKNQLAIENSQLKQVLKMKQIQIQSLAKKRILDNDEYVLNVENLKNLFETQRNQMIRQYESQINVYKSVRKEVLKSQLIKQQAEKVTLINQKNEIESQLKRVNVELNNLQNELNQKNSIIKSFQQKINSLQFQINLNNENRIQPQKYSSEKQKLEIKNQSQKEDSSKVKQLIPQWISNFLSVFKNMVIKLIGLLDPTWSQKKLIIIGWKVVKIIIQKAVKLGIKVPQIINTDQVPECSFVSHTQKSIKIFKNNNSIASKKPIRV